MVQPRNFATRNMHHTTMQHATCSMQHTTIPVNCVRLLRQVGRGIIPRALEQILKSSDSGKHKGWTYTLERQTNLYSLPPQQPTDPYPYPFVAPARPTVGESVRPEFAPGRGSPPPHRDGAHPRHIGTGLTPATSAPGLGSPHATSAPGLSAPGSVSAAARAHPVGFGAAALGLRARAWRYITRRRVAAAQLASPPYARSPGASVGQSWC